MKVMGKRRISITLIITIALSIAGIIYTRNKLDTEIGKVIEISIAIIGAGFVLFQLYGSHFITKAEFLYTLNDTFSDNKNICDIYLKLKEQRDLGTDKIKITDDDGRKMGDYVMFFEIMGYLVDEGIINMCVVDKIFANKFFIFMHNEHVIKNQLVYDGINAPILEFYVKWRNYRIRHKKPPLYGDTLVTKLPNIIIQKDRWYYKNPKMVFQKRLEPDYPSKNGKAEQYFVPIREKRIKSNNE
jgi:hypothetical protein